MRTGTALDLTSATAGTPTSGGLPQPNRIRYSIPQVKEAQLRNLMAAYTLETYILQSVNRHAELAVRNGFELRSEDPAAARDLGARLRQMCFLAGESMYSWIFQISFDLALCANAYLHRRKTRSTLIGGTTARAIAFYDILPPEAVTLEINKERMVETVRVGYDEAYPAAEVIHLAIDRPSGHLLGISPLFPALEDTRLLREMEDITSEMVMKNLHPILHGKTGSDRVPGRQKEINDLDMKLKMMDHHSGYIVTDQQTDLKLIGAESRALRMEGLLKFFRERTFDGLNMHRDPDRAKESITPAMAGRIETIRSGLRRLETSVFYELLYELGFAPLSNPAHVVEILFHPMDPNAQIKDENHSMQTYVQGTKGLNEVRIGMGLPPADDIPPGSVNDFRYMRIDIPVATIKSKSFTSPPDQEPES